MLPSKNSPRFLTFFIVFSIFISLFGCKKDTEQQSSPPPRDRISAVIRNSQSPGITFEPMLHSFVYEDNSNNLEGIAVFNANTLNLLRVFVFEYHPDGRPLRITEVGSDLTTIFRTIDFSHTGGQLSSVATTRILLNNGRVTEIGEVRLEYNNGNVVRTVSLNPSTPGLQISNNLFSNTRNPFSAMFDRIEIPLGLVFVFGVISPTEMLSSSIMTSSDFFHGPSATNHRLEITSTRASNGFVETYRHTSSLNNIIYDFNFEYERRQ